MLNTLYDNWLMTEINTTVKNVIEEGDRYYISLKDHPDMYQLSFAYNSF